MGTLCIAKQYLQQQKTDLSSKDGNHGRQMNALLSFTVFQNVGFLLMFSQLNFIYLYILLLGDNANESMAFTEQDSVSEVISLLKSDSDSRWSRHPYNYNSSSLALQETTASHLNWRGEAEERGHYGRDYERGITNGATVDDGPVHIEEQVEDSSSASESSHPGEYEESDE